MSSSGPTFISLYSGAGGLDLGFTQAGFTPAWANDRDPTAVATYRQNLGPHVIGGEIEGLAIPSEPGVDLVIGGPPCQGFSVAGHMDPSDPRSRHVWVFMDVVEHVQPRAFVMENVKGLAVNQRWAELRGALLRKARSMGYNTELFLLNAAHYDVPQARERMFLVGMRGGIPMAPASTTSEDPPTVREALLSLPTYGTPGNDNACTARVTPARRPVLRRSPFAGMLFNGKGRPLNLLAPASTLPATMGGNRTPIVDQAQLEEGGPCWVESYHARLLNGGGPIKRVPPRLRRLTVEEAAAIQTFPPGWAFAGTQSAQFRQIGNAVPPSLARHVADAVRQALASPKQRRPSGTPTPLLAA
jgi:DNA (cytosine-5)-methyltransferase 1